MTCWNDTYLQLEGDLFGIHILVHMTSLLMTHKVNKRGKKSLRVSIARKDELGEENLKALVGCNQSDTTEALRCMFKIYVSAANKVQHTVSSDIVTANDSGIPIFQR